MSAALGASCRLEIVAVAARSTNSNAGTESLGTLTRPCGVSARHPITRHRHARARAGPRFAARSLKIQQSGGAARHVLAVSSTSRSLCHEADKLGACQIESRLSASQCLRQLVGIAPDMARLLLVGCISSSAYLESTRILPCSGSNDVSIVLRQCDDILTTPARPISAVEPQMFTCRIVTAGSNAARRH